MSRAGGVDSNAQLENEPEVPHVHDGSRRFANTRVPLGRTPKLDMFTWA